MHMAKCVCLGCHHQIRELVHIGDAHLFALLTQYGMPLAIGIFSYLRARMLFDAIGIFSIQDSGYLH